MSGDWGPQQGLPAERGHVKERQKTSKNVKTFFVQGMQKKVKNRQKVSKLFFDIFLIIFARHQFSGPLWGGGGVSGDWGS